MCQINNGCSIPIESVRICVKQFVQLNSYTSVYRRNRKLGEKKFDGLGLGAGKNGLVGAKILSIVKEFLRGSAEKKETGKWCIFTRFL